MISRKFSLISGFMCLLLILSLGSVAVYALISHTLHTSTTVSFKATAVKGSISGEATGFETEQTFDEQSFDAYSSMLPQNLLPWSAGAIEPLKPNITNGSPENIVFIFTITNKTPNHNMLVAITGLPAESGLEDNFTLVSVTQKANGLATETAVTNDNGTYKMTAINNSAQAPYPSSILYITFEVPDDTDTSGTLSFDIAMTRA